MKQKNARECCWWDTCKWYIDKHIFLCKECNRNNVINRHDKKRDNYRYREIKNEKCIVEYKMQDMKNKNEYGTVLNLDAKIVRPRCAITCAKYKYLERENAGKVQVRCNKCKDRRYCAQAI